jgi:hypothetical protein
MAGLTLLVSQCRTKEEYNFLCTRVQTLPQREWPVYLLLTLRPSYFALRVQVDAFNLPNHTNPYGFSAALGSANYGQITSTRDSRRIVLGARLSF